MIGHVIFLIQCLCDLYEGVYCGLREGLQVIHKVFRWHLKVLYALYEGFMWYLWMWTLVTRLVLRNLEEKVVCYSLRFINLTKQETLKHEVCLKEFVSFAIKLYAHSFCATVIYSTVFSIFTKTVVLQSRL